MSQNQAENASEASEGEELPNTNGIYMSVFFFQYQYIFTNLSEN